MVEPLWWGRGSSICLGVQVPGPTDVYYKVFMGNGKTGEKTECMLLANDQLRELGQFLSNLANGKNFENG